MQLSGFSTKTQNCYANRINDIQKYFQKSILEISPEEVRKYFLFIRNVKNLSSSSQANLYYAILFFMKLYGCGDKLSLVPKVKRTYGLPSVLSKKEVETFLNKINNLKYRAIFYTIYGGGLRVSELCNLKLYNLDFDRMQIQIQCAKGNKDRYTILSKRNLDILKKYIEKYKPTDSLFYAKTNRERKMPQRQIQAYFSQQLHVAGIKKKASVHTLRHSFATHLLEAGVNIFYIQRLLGHASISSTSRYLHIQDFSTLNITSPLDSKHYQIENLKKTESVQQWLNFERT